MEQSYEFFFTNIRGKVGLVMLASTLASYPGPFEKSEKRAWYPLFAHALN